MTSEPDLWSIAATFIAACALIATVWQAHLTRKHNRLSVRPILVWERSRIVRNDGIELIYSVRNHGVGPAIIRDRFFLLKGNRFSTEDAHGDEILELSQALLKDKIQYFLLQHGLPGTKTTIPQNGEHVIARVYFPSITSLQLEATLGELDEVTFCLNYASLYNKRFELKESF